ncbi:neuromedin-B [Protopterus annectens]|uniref:neuromedin-B n=1 Tax=Protopterus annectens TaxID=7888 RepID=UPI001CFB4C64|nr:neuromedin-B [Protopterus annectens]
MFHTTAKTVQVSSLFWVGFLFPLLFFSFVSVTVSVSVDLTELRNKVAKIKVNPRGNLWATGHFMGKKSLLETPLLDSPDSTMENDIHFSLSPGLSMEDMKQLLTREVLKIAMQAQQMETSQEKLEPDDQGTRLLIKILQSYIQNSRK